MRPDVARSVAPPAAARVAGTPLALSGVSKSFRGVVTGPAAPAIRDVTFDVAPGEFVCLVGPSGSGKTTVLELLAGLTFPDDGRVLVDGRPVTGPGPDRPMLFQDPALFPWMTVLRNVEFALELSGVPHDERVDRAREWLAKVHLSRMADAQPHELSGGMRQRAALARALACRPGVLLADEPFGALDAQTREVLQEELQRVWSDVGTTLLFVTHNVNEAVFLADRVLIMSAPPGTLLAEYRITVPRPRDFEDVLLSKVIVDIHDQLHREVEKVVARETGRPTGLA
jgi:ABC-type nitrate/sulfonate/bicarbonate transport system ATPase subunit